MAETWEEIVGESKATAKDLFKLIVRQGEVKADEAAHLMGVERSVIDSWTKLLKDKNYAVIEDANDSDPTLKPTDEILAKIEEHKGGKDQGSILGKELARERQLREKLEAELRENEYILEGVKSELMLEKKAKAELEEKIKQLDKRVDGEAGANVSELEEQLERERAERLKLEELVRRGEQETANKNEQEGMGEAEKMRTIASSVEPKKQVTEVKKWAQLTKPDEKPVASVKKEDVETVSKDIQEEEDYGKPSVKDSSRDKIDATQLIQLLSKEGSLKRSQLSAKLNVDDDTLSKWIKDMSGKGVVEVKKHLFKGSDIRIRDGVDVESVIQELRKQKIKEEIRRLREDK